SHPPMQPGARPGFPAIAYAMKPARITGMSVNAVTPMSRTSFRTGELEKSGPFAVIGTNAMDAAIMMPPHAMNGIAYDTPLSRYCRSLISDSFMCVPDLSRGAHNVGVAARSSACNGGSRHSHDCETGRVGASLRLSAPDERFAKLRFDAVDTQLKTRTIHW